MAILAYCLLSQHNSDWKNGHVTAAQYVEDTECVTGSTSVCDIWTQPNSVTQDYKLFESETCLSSTKSC